MKLVWHEFVYMTLRRWPVIAIYLVVLLVDLVTLMALDSSSHDHNFSNELRFLITPLTFVLVVYLFTEISPYRKSSWCRMRPLENWQLIVSRLIWVVVFLVTPRSLHELIYVSGNGYDMSITMAATIQIFIEDVFLYVLAAGVGWVSGSFLIIALAFIALVISLFIVFEKKALLAESFWGLHHYVAVSGYLF